VLGYETRASQWINSKQGGFVALAIKGLHFGGRPGREEPGNKINAANAAFFF
jgi:hypothetical protein